MIQWLVMTMHVKLDVLCYDVMIDPMSDVTSDVTLFVMSVVMSAVISDVKFFTIQGLNPGCIIQS